MPLLINNRAVPKSDIQNVRTLVSKHPHFKESSATLCSQECRVVGPESLLYVGQREMAATTPQDNVIRYIGCDDATTCHIAILRHSGSRAVGVCHFDGCNTAEGIQVLTDLVKELSAASSGGRLELHLAGGFLDNKNTSEELSSEILAGFHSLEDEIHLKTACVTHLNDIVKDGIHFPVIYGLCVDVETGAICPASFPDKGPDVPLRSARNFTGSHDNFSTSPAQEPAGFELHTREAFMHIRDHPEPMKTVFAGGKPKLFSKKANGAWERIENT